MSEKILLVDDEEGIRKLLGIWLADRGYTVRTAENAERALAMLAEETPEIVITDIKMPGMDGIDLLRRIKRENPDTEVVVITGHGDMDLAIKSLQYETTDFITKPIEDDAMLGALQKCRERIQLRTLMRQYTENLESLLQEKTEALSAIQTATPSPAAAGGAPATYQHYFDQLPGYITVHEPDWTISAANRMFKDDFRFDPGRGARCYEIYLRADEPCADCPVEQTFRTGRSHHREMKMTLADGGTRNVFAWTTPLPDARVPPSQVMMMATDISQIVDLKDHLSSLGLMVGSVSHGIKGLLTGLDGGLYLIGSGVSKDDPDKISDGLETVKLMAGRIRNMVLDILYYAKERELKMVETEVAGFAADLVRIITPKARDNHITLTSRIDPALEQARFMVDADQLRAALLNILENAVDACRDDGRKSAHEIIVSLYPPAPEEGASPADAEGSAAGPSRVVCDISDNGVGMSPATQEKIFTLFFSSKSTQGTGIGLFVARKIIQQHGGAITVTSTQGVGSRFRIDLPLSGA